MFCRPLSIAVMVAALLAPRVARSVPVASKKPDVSKKVVLANLDRYPAHLQLGKTRREIKPKKAAVLSPKKYPMTIEYHSGNNKVGWKKISIPAAGVYGLNFKRGNWTITALKRGKTAAAARAPWPTVVAKSRAVRASRMRAPARRGPINADRNRWHPLARAAWFAGSIYQFVRDEQDRDIVRHLLVAGRERDWQDFKGWLEGNDKIGDRPKAELYDAMDELGKLSDADWKEIETADETDWDRARADVGDLISDEDWKDIAEDYAEIDSADFWEDADVDLNDIDIEDDLDLGEDIDLTEDYSLDDLDIDTDSYDLSDFDDYGGYDGDWGGDLAEDFGGDDGGFLGDDDFGDFGGGDDFDF